MFYKGGMEGPEKPAAPNDSGPADAKKASPRRRDRWWHWLVPLAAIVVPLGVLGGGLYLLWQERVAALQLGVPYITAALGWDAGQATVQSFSQDGLTLTNLVLGPDAGISADEINLRFSPSGLLDGRVEAIEVNGLRLRARLEDRRLVLPLQVTAGTSQPDTPYQMPVLPFNEVVFNNFEVRVETPQGPVDFNSTGQLMAAGTDRVRLDLAVDVEGPMGLRGTLTATGHAANAGARAVTLSLVFDSEAEGLGLAGEGGGSLSATLARNGNTEIIFALDDVALNYKPQGIELKGLSGNGTFVTEGGLPVEATIKFDYQSLAAMGQRLTPGRASLALDHGAVMFESFAALPWATLALNGSGRIDDATEPMTFGLRGRSEVAPFLAAMTLPFQGSGEVDFDIVGSVSDPQELANQLARDPLAWFDKLTLGGRIGLDVHKVGLGELTGAGASGELFVDLAPGSLSVEAPAGLVLTLDALPVSPPKSGNEGLDAALTGPFLVELGGEAGTRPTLHVTQNDNGFELDMETGFHWPGLFGGLRGEVSAAVTADSQMAVQSFDLPYLLASLERVTHGGLEGAAEVLLSDVAGNLDEFSGHISLGLSSPGGEIDGLEIGDLAVESDGPFRFDDGALSFSPSQVSRLTLAGLAAAGGVSVRDPLLVRLDGAENEIRLPIGGKPVFDLTLAPMAVALNLADNPQVVEVTLGAISLMGRNGGVKATVDESAVALPGQPIEIANVLLDGAIDGAGRPSARLRIGTLRHTDNPAFVVPLQLEASMTPDGAGGLKLDGTVMDKSGRLKLVLLGTHDLDKKRGSAVVELKKLTFLPTVLQPATLFPVLRGRTETVDADMGLTVNLGWADGVLDMPANLSVALRELTTSEIRVENSSAEIEFLQLFPPSTPPAQVIHIGLADVGVPLSDGRLMFQILAGRLEAQVRELDMFGGLLNSEPFVFEPGMDPFSVVMTVNGVELDELLAIAKLGDISASGTLDGVIPVFIENGEVAVRGGELTSGGGGGVLSYKPKDIGPVLQDAEFSTGLFLKAVENFHYDKVRVTLNEGDAEDLVLGFHLEGKNPDLYDGAPIELNVNLTGPLRQLLDRGIKTYKLPDRIREQVIGAAGG
ncbi:MAG: intermembrane phospholipid transport protein YdbH family protein [Alphaproteobacteria bacterium]